MSPTTSPSTYARSRPPSVTSPITVHGSSQRAQTSRTPSSIWFAHDGDHPLLRLGDHDLPRLHRVLAKRHAVEVHVDSRSRRSHLRETRREARGAAVLQRLDETRLDELDARLDQLLAGEGIADLDGRPLVGVVLAELGRREHRGAADAVAARRRAVEDDVVARRRPRAPA
jgi:hypothetical protein